MFWIVFKNDASGNIISHTITFQKPTVRELLDGELANGTLPPSAVSEMNLSDKTIMEIVEFFKDTNMFLKSAPLYSSISNIYSPIIAKHAIYERAKENSIENNVEGDFQFFLMDTVHLKTITNYSEMISRILESEPVIRSAIIVSIINSYEYYLKKLMMVWARQFPGYFDNKNQTLTFSQISSFSTIDDLLTEFINSDIDDFFRASHFEQINKIFNKFKIDQDASKIDGIEKFQKFCKLRNLIVHNGSRADKEYCAFFPSGDVNVNDLIKIEHNDVQEAARIVFSVGFRLACVVLLKISKNSKSAALSVIELCQKISYDLIHEYHYEMAEDVLKFILQLKLDFTDQQKKMLKVNYANSIKLQENRNDEFVAVLKGEDWSAATEDFSICIAAISEDIVGLCHLMKLHKNSKKILKESYIDWPVFRNVQESTEFKECYKSVFGEDHKLIMRPILTVGV